MTKDDRYDDDSDPKYVRIGAIIVVIFGVVTWSALIYALALLISR